MFSNQVPPISLWTGQSSRQKKTSLGLCTHILFVDLMVNVVLHLVLMLNLVCHVQAGDSGTDSHNADLARRE